MVFLRGVNVGGHRTFRPSVLAKQLARFEVVNIGAAGTFVVRKPGSRSTFLAELRRKLPFEATVIVCDARELLRMHAATPFGPTAARGDVVRFVSVLSKRRGRTGLPPIQLPSDGPWLVRVIGGAHPFVFGEYRRHMKTIGYLGQLDKLLGDTVTTRNWNTITTIARVLQTAD